MTDNIMFILLTIFSLFLITVTTDIELADTYFSNTIISSSPFIVSFEI